MLDLEIDAELQAWIDPLSPEEFALLEASILAEGCRDPLVVWGGYLLDGHNRYAICQKHGIAFQTFEKSGLRTKSDVKIWMIENQLGKRNATDFARTALALKLKPLLEQRARERQAHGQTAPGITLRPNSDEASFRTDDAVAKMAGVGRDTVRKVEKIIEKASAEVVAQVRAGELSINAAAKTVIPAKPAAAPAVDVAVAPPATPAPAADPPPVEVEHEHVGPSEEEVAAALKADADQAQYIRDLLERTDDPLTIALADVDTMRRMNAVLESRNAGLQNTVNEQIAVIKSLRKKLEKLERAS